MVAFLCAMCYNMSIEKVSLRSNNMYHYSDGSIKGEKNNGKQQKQHRNDYLCE